jgi:stalled ribosome rescue protein Dom34
MVDGPLQSGLGGLTPVTARSLEVIHNLQVAGLYSRILQLQEELRQAQAMVQRLDAQLVAHCARHVKAAVTLDAINTLLETYREGK